MQFLFRLKALMNVFENKDIVTVTAQRVLLCKEELNNIVFHVFKQLLSVIIWGDNGI